MADYPQTKHSEAAAWFLRKVAGELERGRPPEELGEEVEWLGRMMRRAI